MPRSLYTTHIVDGIIIVYDQCDGNQMSVTNNAEGVIDELNRDFGTVGRRVIYRDTDGRWDELKVDNKGAFSGFGSLGTEDLLQALEMVKGHRNVD